MCEHCYRSEFGAPKVLNDRVRAAAKRVREIEDDNADLVGSLHIVIDDWNLDDENVAETGIAELIACSVEERASALAITQGMWELDEITGGV